MTREGDEVERFRSSVYDRLYGELTEVQKHRQEILCELQDYAALLVVIRNMQNNSEKISIRTSLGRQVFLNADLATQNTVIVKLGGDLFAELKLARAEIFIGEKLEILKRKADICLEFSSKIRATMKLIMATIIMVAANHVKESAIRSLITIGCRGKTRPKSVDANALRLLTTLANVVISETLLRAAQRARADGRSTVTLDDFRHVLPLILLDFSI